MYLRVLLFLSWLLLPQPTLGINTTTTTITTAVDAITNSTFFIATNGSCSLTCGNLSVPYPFGIGVGLGCSIDPRFDINCSHSFDPPKAFITTSNVEVLNISQNQVKVRNSVASACYDNNGNETTSSPGWVTLGDLGGFPYTFSDMANKFTVVGCDDLALISGTFGNKALLSGCMSICFDRSDVGDRSGYYQTDIPKGLTDYNISLGSVFNHTRGEGLKGSKQVPVTALSASIKSPPYIDECANPDLNGCDKVNGFCRNTPGNYSCYCNPHYYGDGKSCTKKASQFPVIKFSLDAIKKEQAVDAKVAKTIAKHKEELDQVDSSAYQVGQNKAAKYYAFGQGLDAAQVQRDAPIRQIPKAPIPDVAISPSAEEEPTEESTEHVQDESKPPAQHDSYSPFKNLDCRTLVCLAGQLRTLWNLTPKLWLAPCFVYLFGE
ncbi:hypothetical protein Vadar_017159 [Vaccinium darrowii]|uniref:Uncharacterized protein n=1 Tax=Vaccinium darrowii TaxID=229202 RepID=A0ACB7XSP9_9ERIC|nr:hypothetical protein Vadar_017159 [Vaccinium darrowii]